MKVHAPHAAIRRLLAATGVVIAMVAWPAASATAARPEPAVSIGDGSVTEGDSGDTRIDFTISIEDSRGKPVTVAWRTVNGTASSGTDYAGNSGVLELSKKQPTATVSVLVRGDTLEEADETFDVVITVDRGVAVDGTGTGTIRNDDGAAP